MPIMGDAESNQQSAMSRSILESVIKPDTNKDSKRKIGRGLSFMDGTTPQVSGYKKSLVDDFNNIQSKLQFDFDLSD